MMRSMTQRTSCIPMCVPLPTGSEFGSCGRASISMREKEKAVGWRDSVPTGMGVSVCRMDWGLLERSFVCEDDDLEGHH